MLRILNYFLFFAIVLSLFTFSYGENPKTEPVIVGVATAVLVVPNASGTLQLVKTEVVGVPLVMEESPLKKSHPSVITGKYTTLEFSPTNPETVKNLKSEDSATEMKLDETKTEIKE